MYTSPCNESSEKVQKQIALWFLYTSNTWQNFNNSSVWQWSLNTVKCANMNFWLPGNKFDPLSSHINTILLCFVSAYLAKLKYYHFTFFSQRARSKAGFLLAEKTVTFSTFINIIWKDTEKHVIKRTNFVFILFRRYNIEKLKKKKSIFKK